MDKATERLSFRASRGEVEALNRRALIENRSVSQLVRVLVQTGLGTSPPPLPFPRLVALEEPR